MKKLSLLVMITSIMVSLGCASDDAPSVVADTESPAAPLNLIASNITGTSALLSWDAATDNVAVTSYQIYQGATLVETNLTATSFSPLGLTEGSGYSYYIRALDAAGNESDGSNTVTFTTQEASLVFETTLSEMGVFSGTLADLNPADGVQLFELNSALFTDYAAKQRLIRLPNGQAMRYESSDLFPKFPDNTLMAKTFYYTLDETNPNSEKQIIETRISIKVDGVWSMRTYIWNPAQTEATYDEEGSSLPVSYTDSNGATQNINYVIPTRANCITCHSKSSVVTPIGPKLRNWNFIPSYTSQNQLDYFASIGILEGVNVANTSVLPDWTDATLDIFSRGRAYIDINCAHCHQPGGEVTNFGLDFRLETAYDDTGIYANRGEIEERIQSNVPTYRMPQIGRSAVHEEAVTMLLEYLDALD
ncbi:MAG: putative repeat protein (TIGR03806 family) [Flavobacteriaceae bacterium]|jgi:uncharacterized repeat protein (TIGR03806 family)